MSNLRKLLRVFCFIPWKAMKSQLHSQLLKENGWKKWMCTMHSHEHMLERCAAQLSSAVRVRASRSAVADWQFALTGLSGPNISCVKQQYQPGCFQKSWGRVWQAESSHSRCSLTLPRPQANAQMQMFAQATGRGDKTHQVTLPFRTVNTLLCHRCVIPSYQMIIVIQCDRQHLCEPQGKWMDKLGDRTSRSADTDTVAMSASEIIQVIMRPSFIVQDGQDKENVTE